MLKLMTLLLVASGLFSHASSSQRQDLDEPVCPAWFENAPALGDGRPPNSVPSKGLASVTICRYLHAFIGGEVEHHPPLHTNLVSEGSVGKSASVRSIASSFDGLTPFPHPKAETTYCGIEGSGGFYVEFLYRNGLHISATVIPSGCQRVIIGRHGKLSPLPTSLLHRLAKIAPPH